MGAPIDSDAIRIPAWVRSLVSDAPSSIPTSAPRSAPRADRDRAAERAARELRRIIYAAIERYSRTLDFQLHVPGKYKRGPSFDDVMGYLADMGKDFAADSATMHRRVRSALMSEYESADAVPLMLEFRETAAEAILGTIVARVENRLRDVPIKSNSQAYTRRKVKSGQDSRTGIRDGFLLAAITDRGRVTVKGTTR